MDKNNLQYQLYQLDNENEVNATISKMEIVQQEGSQAVKRAIVWVRGGE